VWASVGQSSPLNPDFVADWNSSEGDRLHLIDTDADETVAGNQAFTFIGTAPFTAPGQINWFTNGTDTFVQLNTNADPAADAIIQLSGLHTIDASMFFL